MHYYQPEDILFQIRVYIFGIINITARVMLQSPRLPIVSPIIARVSAHRNYRAVSPLRNSGTSRILTIDGTLRAVASAVAAGSGTEASRYTTEQFCIDPHRLGHGLDYSGQGLDCSGHGLDCSGHGLDLSGHGLDRSEHGLDRSEHDQDHTGYGLKGAGLLINSRLPIASVRSRTLQPVLDTAVRLSPVGMRNGLGYRASSLVIV